MGINIKNSSRRTIATSAILLTALCLCAAVCCDRQRGDLFEQINTFTDKRDGQVYRTVKIGKHTWMAENLGFRTDNALYSADSSYCYDEDDSYCKAYGRLYTWKAAMSACPDGWHLPGLEEWGNLMEAVGGEKSVLYDSARYRGGYFGGAGKKLKSKAGWGDSGGGGFSGTVGYGFEALPGGDLVEGGRGFFGAGYDGAFWSATEHEMHLASHYGIRYDGDGVGLDYGYTYRGYAYSVRCVRDALRRIGVGGAQRSAGAAAHTSAQAGGASQVSAKGASFTDSRDGQIYRTVKIGSQTWMAKNLNYATGNATCHGDDIVMCGRYGRLYDFYEAMSACPQGWHLPSSAEWDTLVQYAGGHAAGTRLKSRWGWKYSKWGKSGGDDAFGFSALPSGYLRVGAWWSATESDDCCAYRRGMSVASSGGDGEGVYEGRDDKSNRRAVRCVLGAIEASVDAAAPGPLPRDDAKPTFTDKRDGLVYRTVKIGKQTWMAKNLNFKAGDSYCYDNADSNCVKYGRLYAWKAAMNACPRGWHLPCVGEWDTLMAAVGGTKNHLITPFEHTNYFYYDFVGDKLKSVAGWKDYRPSSDHKADPDAGGRQRLRQVIDWGDFDGSGTMGVWSGNGTDAFGFSAMPGGRRGSDGSFSGIGYFGNWWGTTDSEIVPVYRWQMRNRDILVRSDNDKNMGDAVSVRCVLDSEKGVQ